MENLPFSITRKTLNLLLAYKDRCFNNDSMAILVIFGKVGSGKSVIAQEFMYIFNGNDCHLDQITFNKDEFIKTVLAYRNAAITGDEGISLFFSRGAMTKEGRLMAELMAQIRQKHLIVLVCIPNLLNLDSNILEAASCAFDVWESRIPKQGGGSTTMKGNFRVWPRMAGNDYMTRLIQYLKIRKSQPLKFNPFPEPYDMVAGGPYGEGHKGGFYCVDEAAYKAKKESILQKYQRAVLRKPRNHAIDYATMDKLIKAKVSRPKIAQLLNVSLKVVSNRKTGRHQRGIVSRAKRHKKR